MRVIAKWGAPGALPWRLIALVIVVAALWVPRARDLDRLVTPDEPLWLARSGNFYYALAHGNWADTYQFVHPGVITMWIGAAGYLAGDRDYADEAPGQIDQWHSEIERVLRAQGVSPLDVLDSTRLAMVIAITLLFSAAYWIASRVFGVVWALLGFLFVAFDPFILAHSRLLHVDAPTTALLLLSLLAFLSYLTTGQRRRDLVISGSVAGLAVLSRSTGLFLIPFVGVMVLGQEWARQRGARFELQRLLTVAKPFAVWGLSALATVVAGWPAMWTHPLRTAGNVVAGAVSAAETGHGKEIYFNGHIYPNGDPGWLFYPVTFLWRTTPPVLIGLGLATTALIAFRGQGRRGSQRVTVVTLLVFAAAFTVLMSLSAKKFDRYLLPVYPPLDLVAAWGWIEGVRWLQRRWPRLRTGAMPVIGLLLVAFQAGIAIAAHPYYLSSYNLLFGGSRQAPRVVMVGWGEGLDQVGEFLAGERGIRHLHVRTGAWPDSLRYFVDTSVVEGLYTSDRKGALTWATTDFYVEYITPAQRGWLAPELTAYFAALTPVDVVHLQELTYARVYDVRTAPLPDYFRASSAGMTDWGGRLRIVAHRPPYETVSPGEKATVTFFLQDLAADDRDLGLRLLVLDANGREIGRTEVDLAKSRKPRTIWPVKLGVEIPAGTAPGSYRLAVTVFDRPSGAALPVVDAATGRIGDPLATIDDVVIAASDAVAATPVASDGAGGSSSRFV